MLASLLPPSSVPLRLYSSDAAPAAQRPNGVMDKFTPTRQDKSAETAPVSPEHAPSSWPSAPKPQGDFPLPPPPPPADAVPQSSGPNPEKSPGDYAYDALDTAKKPAFDIHRIIGNKSEEASGHASDVNPLDQPLVVSKALRGRTIFVCQKSKCSPANLGSSNPVAAFRHLFMLCKKQRIKQHYHAQMAHTRPGLKKKRMKGDRTRARFKASFNATARRVAELKRQGW